MRTTSRTRYGPDLAVAFPLLSLQFLASHIVPRLFQTRQTGAACRCPFPSSQAPVDHKSRARCAFDKHFILRSWRDSLNLKDNLVEGVAIVDLQIDNVRFSHNRWTPTGISSAAEAISRLASIGFEADLDSAIGTTASDSADSVDSLHCQLRHITRRSLGGSSMK